MIKVVSRSSQAADRPRLHPSLNKHNQQRHIDRKRRSSDLQKLPAMQRGMIKLMKTDNPRNKADQKQDDAPLGNNQGAILTCIGVDLRVF